MGVEPIRDVKLTGMLKLVASITRTWKVVFNCDRSVLVGGTRGNAP